MLQLFLINRELCLLFIKKLIKFEIFRNFSRKMKIWALVDLLDGN